MGALDQTGSAEPYMPPWHADPAYGDFSNDRRLTDEEIQTIVDWVDAGAPLGNAEDMPELPHFVEGWQLSDRLGPPDAVFQMEEAFIVPASGPDLNPSIDVPMPLDGDKWLVAAEVRGNSRAVHHNVGLSMDPMVSADNDWDGSRATRNVPGKPKARPLRGRFGRNMSARAPAVSASRCLHSAILRYSGKKEHRPLLTLGVWFATPRTSSGAHLLHGAGVVADPDLAIPTGRAELAP